MKLQEYKTKIKFRAGKAMKTAVSFVLAAAAMFLAVPASAQFAKPQDAVKYRKSAMFLMQQNFARVGAMESGKVPFDAKIAAESAAIAEFMSKLPWPAYGEGTDKGDTRAKPEIWTDWASFEAGAKKLETDAGVLALAAKINGSIRDNANIMFGDCKTCHDSFRVPDKK